MVSTHLFCLKRIINNMTCENECFIIRSLIDVNAQVIIFVKKKILVFKSHWYNIWSIEILITLSCFLTYLILYFYIQNRILINSFKLKTWFFCIYFNRKTFSKYIRISNYAFNESWKEKNILNTTLAIWTIYIKNENIN